MAQYSVVVGNVGTVYTGTDRREALAEFEACKGASIGNVGRMAGESVTLFEDSDILREYQGNADE